MNSQTTARPWSFAIHGDGWEASIWSGDVYKVHVADVGPSEKSQAEVAANAKLIAAAPELLEAANKVHAWLVCAAITTPEDMAQSFSDMELALREALAKSGAA